MRAGEPGRDDCGRHLVVSFAGSGPAPVLHYGQEGIHLRARDGQTGLIQGWISFWAGVVTINPLLFARIEATTETALAVFLILGIFSNLTFITGIFLSLGIWAIPEGLGGPYVPGQSTDIGTAFPYALLFALLLFLSAGSYYGLDRWLTSKLGHLGFLASGSFWRSRKQV